MPLTNDTPVFSMLEDIDTAPVAQEKDPAGHYDNLLLEFSDMDIYQLVNPIIHSVNEDCMVHEPYIQLTAKTLKNLGLNRSMKIDDSANPGSSTVANPAMLKAGQDISARIMAQFWSSDKPVKTQIMGKGDPIKYQKANRVRDYMSFQLTRGIDDYRKQDDYLFTHLPYLGTGFKKIYWNGKQIVTEYVSPTDLIVPYDAKSLLKAERITHLITITKSEFKKLIRSEFYCDLDLHPSWVEQTQVDKENDSIVARTLPVEPESYDVCEVHCLLEIPELYPDEGELPYILTYERSSEKLLRLSRNWDAEDPEKIRSEAFVDYKLYPWQGVYGIGLTHQIGNLNDTLSDILNGLIDAGFKQNMITGFKLQSDHMGTSGSQERLSDGVFSNIKLGPGMTDIRQALMQVPMNGPSQTLFELYQSIGAEISSLATINSQLIADSSNNGPVGTTYALIAENAKIFNSIFSRQHNSKAEEFKIIHRLNYKHLDDQTTVKIFGGELVVSRNDFDDDIAVLPVSDPTCSTVAERVGRMQVIGEINQNFPGILSPQQMVKMTLDTIGVPDLDNLILPTPPPAQARDPLANIQAIMKNMPIDAFPEQVAEADYHIAIYTNFLQDPSYGQNQYLVQTGFTMKLLQLIMAFQMLRTSNMFNTIATGKQDSLQPMVGLNAPPLPAMLEHNYVARMADPHALSQVLQANKLMFDQIRPDIESSLAHMPPPPVDPNMVFAIAERDKQKNEAANQAAKMAIEAARIQSDERESENKENQANLRALISAMKTLPPGYNLFGHLPTDVPDEMKQVAAAINQIIKASTPPPQPVPQSTDPSSPMPPGPPGPSGIQGPMPMMGSSLGGGKFPTGK